MHESHDNPLHDANRLKSEIAEWASELGFSAMGVTGIDVAQHRATLTEWLRRGFHGEMAYMAQRAELRLKPDLLQPGALSVISVRMDYLPEAQDQALKLLDHPTKAYVSRYALGRDYHKLMRKRLKHLAARIRDTVGHLNARPFVDSAPVLEKPLAANAGLGWIGKHTNLINKRAGSWFFLGELLTDLPLPADVPADAHCGTCRACIDICPTKAIVAPFQLDARLCISYLTIEHDSDIPEALRKPIGNRIYGCDDCQLVCPWNKFATRTNEPDFMPRHSLDNVALADLAYWSESYWYDAMAGSAIRRIGFHRWQRNIAVALGNAETTESIRAAIAHLQTSDNDQVVRHANWAYAQHTTS
ncbi:MAG: tRNA epoxyqueuosine(34) reductase QueG [Pseudomonadota bacterium]